MLIECCECKARVDGEIVAYHEHEYAACFSIRTYLLKCPDVSTLFRTQG
jgi:hypothetical protein